MKFFGLEIPGITAKEALEQLGEARVIFTPNPEILLEARKNKKFLRVLKKADLLLPDGNGLQLVSTLKRWPSKWMRAFFYLPCLFTFLIYKRPFKRVVPEIIHGSDFMSSVIDWAELNNKSVFFLGAAPGVAQECADFFSKRNSKLIVAGTSHLNPGKQAADLVLKSKTKVLLVAYGAPKQELWIHEWLPKFKQLELIMAVGGSFDFWSGNIRRAPKWMRKLGLEWLWRLMLNPKQRAGRIYNAFIKFPLTSLFYDA